jgi:hypothetical protein
MTSVQLAAVKLFVTEFTLSETFITPHVQLAVICKNQVLNIEKSFLTVGLSNNTVKTVADMTEMIDLIAPSSLRVVMRGMEVLILKNKDEIVYTCLYYIAKFVSRKLFECAISYIRGGSSQ